MSTINDECGCVDQCSVEVQLDHDECTQECVIEYLNGSEGSLRRCLLRYCMVGRLLCGCDHQTLCGVTTMNDVQKSRVPFEHAYQVILSMVTEADALGIPRDNEDLNSTLENVLVELGWLVSEFRAVCTTGLSKVELDRMN